MGTINVPMPKRIVFRSRAVDRGPFNYKPSWVMVWDADKEVDTTTIRNLSPDLVQALLLQHDAINLGGESEARYYAAWVSDCFEPPIHLIEAENEQEAFDWFITEKEHYVKIYEGDLPDYEKDGGDRITINDNGTPVDTESVELVRLDIVRIEYAEKIDR